ncbi:hypothetical protein N7490_001309 [Penicillium lividum]|nr:hypothetical protein N7490_001309 [Penicillium lividum]
MNPNQFPNAPGGGGMVGGKPGMQPPKDNQQIQGIIMSHVAQVLQNQGPFSGWKAEITNKTRMMNIWQMITSLRLIQPRIDISAAAQAALSFEQKAFIQANERGDYDRECNEKLSHIKDTRQRQAAVMQNGMMPQLALQAAFPQQMTRGMQSSPIPGQQQMPMGMNDPNQQATMQQRQPQQSGMLPQQRAQQRPTSSGPLHDDLNNLSPQDLEHVSRLASQMLAKTGPEDMEKIKMNLSNMSVEQRTYLARKNMDPMTYFFRSQALNQLRRHRRARMEMGRANNPGMDPNGAMMGDPMMNQRQMLQNMMNLQRNSGFSGSPGQSIDSNFIGNVENIQGQQADGLRSQEAGQLVVPASSSQMNQQPFPNQPQQNMFPQQMGQTGQGMNPQLFGQKNFQGSSNVPQDRMAFQAQQSQAQAQAQARAAAQKAQLALSGHNGQANPQTQTHMPQSSPAMPMLNQPMAPGQMSPVQAPGQPRPPSRPPNTGQPNMQGRPQIPATLPQAVQDQLAQMTNEQLQQFFVTQRRNAMANNIARNGGQQPGSLQQAVSQGGQGQAIFNGQMPGNGRMRNSMSMPQGMNPAGSAPPQQIPGQGLTPQQRMQQQRQQELYKLHILQQQQGNALEMTPEQVKDMDRTAFPPNLINHNHSASQVPRQIRTWGQLKQWVTANPQASNGVDLSKLMMLQKLHFGSVLASRAGVPNNQNQGILSQPQGQPGQMPNGQNLPNGQPQPQMPQMRPLTPGDIHMARQRMGPNGNNITDEQIRDLIQHRHRQMLQQAAAQAARARQEMNANGANMSPGQPNQLMQQPPVSVPQNAAQLNLTAVPQPPATTDQQQSNAKAQPGAPAKNAKAAAAKQSQKSKAKMDETGEAQASTTPQMPHQPAVAAAAPPAARPGPPPSHEQLHSMTPHQRMQVEGHMRKQQQNFLRGPIISRAAAEENWRTHLKPEILSVYMEIAKSAPPTQPVVTSPEQKAVMSQLLMDSLDILGRLDILMTHGFAKMQGQEKNARNLLAMRVQIMRQFKNTQEWALNDNFTITQDYLTGAILFIRKLFQVMILRMNQQRPNGAPAPAPQATSTTALNATNLEQLQQQQEEALQHARRASNQSGAAVAPAPFGAPSPQGVPHAYGPGGLAPEKLKLPPPKKRKQSHAGAASASPVQHNPASVAAATHQAAMANAKTQAAALAGTFKCSVIDCQQHFLGFPTQAALNKHVEENHQPENEEGIENPLQYYIDSLDIGLGLTPATPANQNGKPSPGKQADSAASARQLASYQAAIESSKLLSPGKQARKRTLDDLEAEDPWANAPMNLEKIHDTFGPIFSECRRLAHGYDPMEEFVNTDMLSRDQSDDTPDSLDNALATMTPKDDHKDFDGDDTWFEAWDEPSIEAAKAWLKLPPDSEYPTNVHFPPGPNGRLFDWAKGEPQNDINMENGTVVIAAV